MIRLLIFTIILLYPVMGSTNNISIAYFGGGCFWCMEESFESQEGVLEVVSGYSGGSTKNPTYKEVTFGNTGHFETIKVKYDNDKINYKEILNTFWINIDPFDSMGQFCDKGYSYRSVVFYAQESEKKLIEESIIKIEKKFKKKIVTFIRKFDEFYEAEEYHQDYYKKKFINYIMYKNSCGRTQTLKNIWD